jgi:hypothetical protein
MALPGLAVNRTEVDRPQAETARSGSKSGAAAIAVLPRRHADLDAEAMWPMGKQLALTVTTSVRSAAAGPGAAV